MRKITVGEYLDALDKNGFEWTKAWFYFDGRSCAMGQALRNLGYAIKGEGDDENSRYENKLGSDLGWELNVKLRWLFKDFNVNGKLNQPKSLIDYNDQNAEAYSDVVAYAHEQLDHVRDTVIELLRG